MKIVKICCLMLASATLISSPAYSKNDHGHGHKYKKHHENQRVAFDNQTRTTVVNYLQYKHPKRVKNYNYSTRSCPPGLAKKNPWCMPPGQYKKYSVGAPLAPNVTWNYLPNGLLRQLPPPPRNTYYGMVDNDVLLMSDQDNQTRIVLDAISLMTGQQY